MSRTMKMLAVGVAALGIAAAAASPTLANRQQVPASADHQGSVEAANRHVTVQPADTRHTT